MTSPGTPTAIRFVDDRGEITQAQEAMHSVVKSFGAEKNIIHHHIFCPPEQITIFGAGMKRFAEHVFIKKAYSEAEFDGWQRPLRTVDGYGNQFTYCIPLQSLYIDVLDISKKWLAQMTRELNIRNMTDYIHTVSLGMTDTQTFEPYEQDAPEVDDLCRAAFDGIETIMDCNRAVMRGCVIGPCDSFEFRLVTMLKDGRVEGHTIRGGHDQQETDAVASVINILKAADVKVTRII